MTLPYHSAPRLCSVPVCYVILHITNLFIVISGLVKLPSDFLAFFPYMTIIVSYKLIIICVLENKARYLYFYRPGWNVVSFKTNVLTFRMHLSTKLHGVTFQVIAVFTFTAMITSSLTKITVTIIIWI